MIVRPSGTEPKLKCYLEVVVPVHPEDGVDAARIAAAGRLDALRDDIKAAARHLRARRPRGAAQVTSERDERRQATASAAISGQAQAADAGGQRARLLRDALRDAAAPRALVGELAIRSSTKTGYGDSRRWPDVRHRRLLPGGDRGSAAACARLRGPATVCRRDRPIAGET